MTPEGIHEAIAVLKKGGVVGYPADTCFGLTACMDNPKAIEKLIAIKGRDDLKPMSVMFGNVNELNHYVLIDELNLSVLESLFPGPYTVILTKGPKTPSFYFPESKTLGVRIPNHALSLELIEGVGKPLITTSANRSGGALTYTTDDAAKAFDDAATLPDLMFEGTIDEPDGASTVLEVKDGKAIILREGRVRREELGKRLGMPVEWID